jgi:hypothetical protein
MASVWGQGLKYEVKPTLHTGPGTWQNLTPDKPLWVFQSLNIKSIIFWPFTRLTRLKLGRFKNWQLVYGMGVNHNLQWNYEKKGRDHLSASLTENKVLKHVCLFLGGIDKQCNHRVQPKIMDVVDMVIHPGLGPNNKNTLKNSLNSCQIYRLLKLLSNIYNCVHMKQFKRTILVF